MKIKRVTPIRSDTLCERCEYGVPKEQTNGCLKAKYGKPCFFFKRKIPSLQIGNYKYSFYNDHITLSYVGNNEEPSFIKEPDADVDKVVKCKDCKQGYIKSPNSKIKICWCGKWNNIMPQDGYCSFGERKEV